MKYYCSHIWIASTLAGIAQNRQKCLIFIVVPQVRTKMRGKGKLGKQKNPLKMSTHRHLNIYKCRYKYSHKQIICYSSQIVLFDIMLEKVWIILSFNWARQAVLNIGTNIRSSFLSHVCFAKMIWKFRKVISCAYPTIVGKFKNFIQIIRQVLLMKL